jgi:Tfp pilus assembly protein PilF
MMARLRSLLTLPRRHPVVALALCLLAAGAYPAGWYWYAEHHRRAAERAAARYDFDEALGQLAACLRARPRSAALHLQVARVARRAGHYEQAAEHLDRCEELGGITPETALERALLRAARGDLAAAEGPLQEQLDRGSPEAPQILEALAQGYIRAYRLGNARSCLDRLLERDPAHVRALIWRASLRQSAGDDAGAEDDYRRAVAAQPDHVGARCRYGEYLLRHARPEEALGQYEPLRPRPGGDQPAVLLGLARSHRQLDATDAAGAARQALDALLARQPQHAEALLERGKLALAVESPAEAEGWLRRAAAAAPFSAQANWALAQALRRQGKDGAQQYEEAHDRLVGDRKRLEAALERVGKSPSDPAPRVEAGRICLRTGKDREGLRWLLSALQQAPRDGPTHAALAEYYERAGRRDLAANHRRLAEQAGAAAQSP